MSLIQIPLDTYTDLCKSCSIIFSIVTVCIGCYHIWSTKKSKKAKISIFGTFVSFAIALILESQLILAIFDPFQKPYCEIIRVTLPSLYSLWKLTIYIILSLRIYEAFGSSSIAHKPGILIFYSIIFSIWSIFNITYGIINNNTITLDDKNLRCLLITDNFLIVSTVLLDATAGIIYTYLFILPFKVIESQLELQLLDKRRMRRTAFKQFILSISAIISTMIAKAGYAVFSMPQFFITLDINISSLCIILMYNWNSNLLSKLCFCCMPPIKRNKNIQRTISEAVVDRTQKNDKSEHRSSAQSDHNDGGCGLAEVDGKRGSQHVVVVDVDNNQQLQMEKCMSFSMGEEEEVNDVVSVGSGDNNNDFIE